MRKILPLGNPEIRAYSKHAHILAILSAQSEQYIPWIYNYYVQLYIPNDYEEFNIDYLIPSIFTFAPNLFVSRIERRVAINVKDGIIDSFKYFIDNGYYIYTLLEVDQIADYQRDYFCTHDPLLYGYDNEKEIFYFADVYQQGKYAYGVASYEEVKKAVGTEEQWKEWKATEWVLDVVCMKYKDLDVRFQFDKEMFKELLLEYMEQSDSYHLHWGVRGWTKGPETTSIYGMGIYSHTEKYIMLEKEKKEGLDIRGFFVIWEHKVMLKNALTYLLGECWEEKYPTEGQLFQEEIDRAHIMVNLSLKYNLTGKTELLSRLADYVKKMFCEEQILFPRIMSILENS